MRARSFASGNSRRAWEEAREFAFERFGEVQDARSVAERSVRLEHGNTAIFPCRQRFEGQVLVQRLGVARRVRRVRYEHDDGVRIQTDELLDREPRDAGYVGRDGIASA